FESYLWSTGETTESITVQNPETGQEFSCVLTSVTGCTVTLTSVLTPSIVFAGFDYEGHCMNAIDLIDESFVESGPPIDSIVWNFGDGTLAYGDTAFHQFEGPGPHDITQVVFSETGCTDTLVQTISFDPSPVVDFEISPACVDQPTQFEDVTFLADGVAQRIWDFGNGSTTIGDTSPSQIYDATGTFDDSLYIQYNNGCHDSLTVPVTVYETPVVDIGPDSMFCGGTEWLLDAGNPAFAHEWNTGDQQQTLLVTETGDYSVIVTTNEGCTETDTASIYFHPLPVLQLNDTSACV